MYFFHKRVKKVKRPPTWNQAVSCGEDITHCLLFVLGLFAMAVTWAVNLGTKLEKFSLLNADKKWSCPFEHWVRHQADQWLQSNLYLEAQSFGSQILEWSYSKVFAWTTELPKKSFYSWHSRDSYSQYFKTRFRLLRMSVCLSFSSLSVIYAWNQQPSKSPICKFFSVLDLNFPTCWNEGYSSGVLAN